MTKSNKIKDFIMKSAPGHPQTLVRYVANHFSLSPQAVQRHVNRLIADGRLHKSGSTRNSSYTVLNAGMRASQNQVSAKELPTEIPSSKILESKKWGFELDAKTSEDQIWTEILKDRLKVFPKNIFSIVEFGATEMINNVIDHSQGTKLRIEFYKTKSHIRIVVVDNGLGVFQKIANAFVLGDLRESILHLTKGKFTTDPQRHSGQGIFFTSRMFDEFALMSNGLMYWRTNLKNEEADWLVASSDHKLGTAVSMTIDVKSSRTAKRVFERYSNPSQDDYEFSKTTCAIELGKFPGETYVSRSQAKRILMGLESFKKVILDFRRVEEVGQGFVDEVFRVFRNAHPQIEIEYVNANSDVEFMIKRSL